MRHYTLIPVRYNEQQLLVPCPAIDAELWSIQWRHTGGMAYTDVTPPRIHWFADVSPMEHDEAEAIVTWLNNRQALLATLPADLTVVSSRGKP